MDDSVWQPQELTTIGSFWGHKGLFEALGDGPPMPKPVRRAPLQVMEGNYQRMSGVCPWWDAAKGQG